MPTQTLAHAPGRLFVLNYHFPPLALDQYRLSGGAPLDRLPLSDTPQWVTADNGGTLYVMSEQGSTTLAEYAPGAKEPSRTITQGLSDPFGMAIDKDDNLWVLDRNVEAGGPLVRYAPGAVQPNLVTYKGFCSYQPIGAMTIDRFGTIYIAGYCSRGGSPKGNVINEYDGGASIGRTITLPRYYQPVGMTTDSTGRLYVESCAPKNTSKLFSFIEYNRHSIKPAVSFTFGSLPPGAAAQIQLNRPTVDPLTDRLYVEYKTYTTQPNGRGTWGAGIYAFARGKATSAMRLALPVSKIFSTPLDLEPSFDDAGDLYVEAGPGFGYPGTILRFKNGSRSGNRVLQGRMTLLFPWPGADARVSTEGTSAACG